jgi:hypothetical protein
MLFGELAGLGVFGMRYPEDVGGCGMRLTGFGLARAAVVAANRQAFIAGRIAAGGMRTGV